jgi:ATP-binding protein involved in chromosome partitioning
MADVSRGAPDEAMIRAALAGLPTPDGQGVAARLGDLLVDQSVIQVSLAVTPAEAPVYEPVRQAVVAAVQQAFPGMTVRALLTAERPPQPASKPPAARPPSAAAPTSFKSLAGIRSIVAVASGKGGVGKSTTAVNLALALAQQRGPQGALKVGLLDADIYGPSVPRLLALKGEPRIIEGKRLAPMTALGLEVMSIGFLVPAEKAMIWRGPMVDAAVTQMLRDIAWGALDVLIVDMPPGTGDAQLALSQKAPLAGAVIVSTPQELALIDARRGVAMFRDVGVPILGLVENMSYFLCDDCGKRHHLFGHGGAEREAERLGVPFLGAVPLDPAIRDRSDAGLPIVVADPDGASAAAYRAMAADLVKRIRLSVSATAS